MISVVIVQDDKRRTEHAVVAVRYEQKWLILDNLTMAIITAPTQSKVIEK